MSRDLRPPDYATHFVRLAVEGSGLDEPIAVCGITRPPWLAAVVDEVGVITCTIEEALAPVRVACELMAACEIGLVLAFDGAPGRGASYVRDVAQAAEGLGFHSIWVPEHVVFFEEYESRYPYPPSPGSTETPSLPAGERPGLYDPLFACGAIAAATTTLRVGTAVALVPLRHPLLLAREVTSLDHFTGGRFTLGVGVGWLAEEFAALNVPFAERGAIADEHLDALRALMADEVASFHGTYVNFDGAVMLPMPLTPGGPPILVGGNTAAALRRVARSGDGWYAWNLTPAEFEHGLERLAARRAPSTIWSCRSASASAARSTSWPCWSTPTPRSAPPG